jgi:hypothetical protein
MGLFNWLTPEVSGLPAVPGDPGTLRSSARVFSAAAEEADTQARRIEASVSSVVGNSWFGIASFAFSALARTAAQDVAVAGPAFRTSAGALNTLAAEIEAAQEVVRRAQAQASELNSSSARLDQQYSEAQAADQATQANPNATPGPSPIPGLVAEAGLLQLQALGIRAQAATAVQQAQAAAQRAAQTFSEVRSMTPSVRRAAEARARAAAEAAAQEEERGGFMGVLDDIGDGFGAAKDFAVGGAEAVWDTGSDFVVGAYDGIKDPLVMLYNLTPLNGDWTESWKDLGNGLWYGVQHPLEFGKALIGWDNLQERGFAYWLGNLAPSAAAAFFTGGAAAGARGASATSKLMKGLDDVSDVSRVARTADNVDELSDFARLSRIDDAKFAREGANFLPGSTLRETTWGQERLFINIHDGTKAVGAGRSRSWQTPLENAIRYPDLETFKNRSALLDAWGDRNSFEISRVPPDYEVMIRSGRANWKVDFGNQEFRMGGGRQDLFQEYPQQWVVKQGSADQFFSARGRAWAEATPRHPWAHGAGAGAGVYLPGKIEDIQGLPQCSGG